MSHPVLSPGTTIQLANGRRQRVRKIAFFQQYSDILMPVLDPQTEPDDIMMAGLALASGQHIHAFGDGLEDVLINLFAQFTIVEPTLVGHRPEDIADILFQED